MSGQNNTRGAPKTVPKSLKLPAEAAKDLEEISKIEKRSEHGLMLEGVLDLIKRKKKRSR